MSSGVAQAWAMPRTRAALRSAQCEAFFMVSSRTAVTRTGVEEDPIQGTERPPMSLTLQSSTRRSHLWYRVAALVPLYSTHDCIQRTTRLEPASGAPAGSADELH